MKENTFIQYKDGSKFKHVKNRSVSVFKNQNDCGGIVIEFAKADVKKEDFVKPCAINKVIKNKVQVTGLPLSNEAAYGLYLCLHDYFERMS